MHLANLSDDSPNGFHVFLGLAVRTSREVSRKSFRVSELDPKCHILQGMRTRRGSWNDNLIELSVFIRLRRV